MVNNSKHMNIIKLFFFIILTLIVLCSCNNTSYQSNFNSSTNQNKTIANNDNKIISDYKDIINDEVLLDNKSEKVDETTKKAQDILNDMTLNEKIGQLFIIHPEKLYVDENNKLLPYDSSNHSTIFNNIMKETLQKYPVGGIIMFADNIQTPDQIKTYINDFQNNSKIPLFIGVDEEGGTVARVANNDNFDVIKYESMKSIGDTNDTNEAFNVGKNIGEYLKEYGFNITFAPVTDINLYNRSMPIGDRSFGITPELVSKMAQLTIDGFHNSQIMTCTKHFPGIGDTKRDSHNNSVKIEKTWEELISFELIPFIKTMKSTDMIMVAHILTPNITNDELPCSLSYEMITEKLRTELGYEGVIITDSLSMGSIHCNNTASESAVKCIKAGTDIALMPTDYIEAFEGVYTAVENGEISESTIDESVLRILKLKVKYGLIK